MFKKFVTEPLIHFLLIGIFLFMAYSLLNPVEPDPNTIIVSEGRIAQIKNNFLNRWNREPLPEEMENAARHYALNEMYLREARAIGMDRGDQVIDRRLRQKMAYMLEDLAAVKQPTEEELKQYFREHSDKYMQAMKYSLRQVYISADRPPSELQAILQQQTRRVEQGLAIEGDNSLLPAQLNLASPAEINKHFGNGFAEKLNDLKINEWQGPVSSALGHHFIVISERLTAQLKPYEVVAAQVLKDWRYQNNATVKLAFEEELLKNYRIERALPQVGEVAQ